METREMDATNDGMRVVPFFAESPAAALEQIHRELGPEAVVLSVKKVPSGGLGRFLGRTGVEVVAAVQSKVQSPKSKVERLEQSEVNALSVRSCDGTKGSSAIVKSTTADWNFKGEELRPQAVESLEVEFQKAPAATAPQRRVSIFQASKFKQHATKDCANPQQKIEISAAEENLEVHAVSIKESNTHAKLEAGATADRQTVDAIERRVSREMEQEFNHRDAKRTEEQSRNYRSSTIEAQVAPALSSSNTRHSRFGAGRTPSAMTFESMGLLPIFAQRLEESAKAGPAGHDPALGWQIVEEELRKAWRTAPKLEDGSGRPHVFIGPAGVGKTTLLCKWLATAVLLEEKKAKVWRLDGSTANTAEVLNVYGEMFGVEVSRVMNLQSEFDFLSPSSKAQSPKSTTQDEFEVEKSEGPIGAAGELEQSSPTFDESTTADEALKVGESSGELKFVDLPGVDDREGMEALKELLGRMGRARIHLVLNGAYDTPVLFEQFRAFAGLGIEDVSFTHLDEEKRRIKLWNFVLGANCPIRFLAGGQRVPGEFCQATVEKVMA